MRIPSLLTASLLLGSSAWAQHDESHFYLQLGLGSVLSEDAEGVPGGTVSFDPGFSASGTFGYDFWLSERLSFDAGLEAYYQYFKVDEEDLAAIPSAEEDDAKAFALLLNGGLEWRFTPQFSMFAGAGVGWAKEIEYEAWDSGNLNVVDDDGVAFQGRLGCDWNLGGSYDVRLGYRYFRTTPVDIEDALAPGQTEEIDVAQHSFEIALRWGVHWSL
jgi:opacity protein-like surface antigen